MLPNRELAVEERLEGWWGRANSSLGAGTIAIVLFQDCELKNAETAGRTAESIEGPFHLCQTQNLVEAESSRQEEQEYGGEVSWSKIKQPQNHRVHSLLSLLSLAQLGLVHKERAR